MGHPTPDLPVLAEDDSMLSRKFGREVANYFSGSPLNRISFLRTDYGFLRAAFAHPSAAFLLLDNLSPLAKDHANLSYVARDVVVPLTGEEPFKESEQEQLKDFNSAITQPVVLFLGIDEKKPDFQYRDYKGKPYFAVDVTPKGTIEAKAKSIVDIVKANGVSFIDGRRLLTLNAPDAAIFAEARALLDWNSRNPFCGGCGQPTTSINAGWKRSCPPTDLAGVPEGGAPKERADCPTRHGISNLCFPRTDPTVIMAVVSADGTKILLGRNKRFPPFWFSTLAGFLEPGESIEEAVRRETWEESGVTVGRVVIHSSQPWPYPANLMIGAIGQATPGGETIHLGHDEELTDARWFSFDEVREGIATGVSGLGDPAPAGYKEGALRLPPQTAIANQLIQAVLNGYLGAVPKI
ncbi:NUDIX hydrolase domain-like protein [Daldinia loculata]|uniref:NUDIX hydrolase domain-like protein n=1 Tax=Daldinia loculata TaxID=103429 RepID=UPI0020C5A072|nr:NUDIX hydrolase domain-like protein [Daldinia loculata]KAI1645359.1 NUDIX hydrolase domain-like protein [Daldinia loculata]KAI2778951.1 NUDIX hydrolase domain-like protein [Daldinia loculata]